MSIESQIKLCIAVFRVQNFACFRLCVVVYGFPNFLFLSIESKILMSFDSCDYAVFKMVNYITVRGLLFLKGRTNREGALLCY